MKMQHEITAPSPLLTARGQLQQIGWARRPLLDCNLEQVHAPFRLKKWDYYCLFLPTHVVAFAIADLSYASSGFVYIIDRQTQQITERAVSLPLASRVQLPRNSTDGVSSFQWQKIAMRFETTLPHRHLVIHWPNFAGKDLHIDVNLSQAPQHDSMAISIPMGERGFYWNHKINCLPVSGSVCWGDVPLTCEPTTTLATFDWGRGIWPYQSRWVWANASGFHHHGQTIGLNLGTGFGDTSRATENAVIVDQRLYKLGHLRFDFSSTQRMNPWIISDDEGRVHLTFTPTLVRTSKVNLLVLKTHVDQIFGHYSGQVRLNDGSDITIQNLWGFAEEHFARW